MWAEGAKPHHDLMSGYSIDTDAWPLGRIPTIILAVIGLLAGGFAFGYGLSGLTDGSVEALSIGSLLIGTAVPIALLRAVRVERVT